MLYQRDLSKMFRKAMKEDFIFTVFKAYVKKTKYPGVYLTGGNLHIILYALFGRDGICEYDFDTFAYKGIEPTLKNYVDLMQTFGVADNIEQILNHPDLKKQFIDSEDQYVLSITSITKKSQPKEGGWRWHKWGQYIGNQKHYYEYIYDEPEVNEVFLYHFYLIKKNALERFEENVKNIL